MAYVALSNCILHCMGRRWQWYSWQSGYVIHQRSAEQILPSYDHSRPTFRYFSLLFVVKYKCSINNILMAGLEPGSSGFKGTRSATVPPPLPTLCTKFRAYKRQTKSHEKRPGIGNPLKIFSHSPCVKAFQIFTKG